MKAGELIEKLRWALAHDGADGMVMLERRNIEQVADFLEKLLRAAKLQAAVDEILKGG